MAKSKREKKLASGDLELCEWKQEEIIKNFDLLREILRKPKYVCLNCARAASKKKYLCKQTVLKR